jgi:Holliday junction resolvase
MPSRKMKGRLLEYAVRRKLRSQGYYVFRCAGSRPVDLIAMKDGKALLIECKAGLNPQLTPKQRNHILDIARIIQGKPILVMRKKYRGLRWFVMTSDDLHEFTF